MPRESQSRVQLSTHTDVVLLQAGPLFEHDLDGNILALPVACAGMYLPFIQGDAKKRKRKLPSEPGPNEH